jgi:hypothetical protein
MVIQLFQPLLSPSEPSNGGEKIYPLVVTITLGILGTLAHFRHFSGLSRLGYSKRVRITRSPKKGKKEFPGLQFNGITEIQD